MITSFLFRISSVVEQWTVNPLVVGSNPTSGVTFKRGSVFLTAFPFENPVLLPEYTISLNHPKQEFYRYTMEIRFGVSIP